LIDLSVSDCFFLNINLQELLEEDKEQEKIKCFNKKILNKNKYSLLSSLSCGQKKEAFIVCLLNVTEKVGKKNTPSKNNLLSFKMNNKLVKHQQTNKKNKN